METQQLEFGEQLILPPNALVFYIDEFGDESLHDPQNPIFAFGGVACVTEHTLSIAHAWQAMKAKTFPQVKGPLHANQHFKERTKEKTRAAVLAEMRNPHLGRFGAIITSNTIVPKDKIMMMTCGALANRFAAVAEGMTKLGLWQSSGPVILIFEHSTRLAHHLETHFSDLALMVGDRNVPIEGCFMPKHIANPFLEMADITASIIGRNIKYQQKYGRTECSPNFQSIFRDAGPILASYFETMHVANS